MADLLSGRVHVARRGRNASRTIYEVEEDDEDGPEARRGPARGVWARLRGREAPEIAVIARTYVVPAYETEAWNTVMYARKSGPHRHPAVHSGQLSTNFRALIYSAAPVDWYFLTLILGVLITIDVVILQQLPETARTHVVLLFFWLLVASIFCVEVWLRQGPQAGVVWLTGYALELIYSLDNVFVVHLIFCTFETPRRLMAKALFVGLLCSIGFRLLLFLGLASMLDRLRLVPYLLGMWFIYCGARQMTVHDDEVADVTQTAIVRSFRSLLGDRLGEFYDEEGEAIVTTSKDKLCMTLLGVVVLCLLSADFFLALDVVLTKAEHLPNPYLSFSSSALALFAIRALFFAARDIFGRFGCVKYGIGLVLVFLGSETLLSHAVYVNALMSCLIVTAIVVLAVAVSSLREPGPKLVA